MEMFLKMLVGLFIVIALAGCIGEDYDYTPPTAILGSDYDIGEGTLGTANVDWNSDEVYKKNTDDIKAFAKKQKPFHFYVGQNVYIDLSHTDFEIKKISAYVIKNNKKTELPADDNSFELPNEEGKYVIIIKLLADKGSVEYAGNLILKNKSDYPYQPDAHLKSGADGEGDKELELIESTWSLEENFDTGIEKMSLREMEEHQKEIFSFAKEQKPLYYSPEQQLKVLFDHRNFKMRELRVQVGQVGSDNKLIDLQVEDQTFNLPNETGRYAILVKLVADKGNAEYIGNIVIK